MIDLSITKDPEWLAERQKKWELIKEYVCDELSKKQREQVYQYFMYGTPPKKITDFYFTQYFNFFPLQTVDGHKFVAENYFSPSEWTERELDSFVNGILLRDLETISRPERLMLFNHYLGDRYDPNRQFPFLIAQEEEFRSFNPDPLKLFRVLNIALRRWIYDPHYESSLNIAPELIDFYFSLIDYQPAQNLSHKPPPKPAYDLDERLKHSIQITIDACELIRELMRLVYTRFTFPIYFSVQDEKLDVINELFNRFESMDQPAFPRELTDHWHWVKRRLKLFELSFQIPEGMEDEIHQIEGDLMRNNEFIVEHLENITGVDLQKAKQLLAEYKYDEHYFVEKRKDAEAGGRDIIAFACTDKAVIDVLSEFFITCGVTKLSCTEILG